jgi:hypothetical protein
MDDAPANPYALHQACLSNEYDTVKRLLDEGAPLSTRWEGRSPLTLAVAGDPSDLRLVDLLLRRGAVPRSVPLTAAARLDDPFDAALRCTRRRVDVLIRLLRNLPSGARLYSATPLLQAAAGFSLDVMREVLLCAARDSAAAYMGQVFDGLRCIDSWYVAVDTHGLAAVEAASILPLMIKLLDGSTLGGVWRNRFITQSPVYDAPTAHAAFLTQLAYCGAATANDLARLIAMDADEALIDSVAAAGCPHPYRDSEDASVRLIPRLFSAVGQGDLGTLLATMSRDDVVQANGARDLFCQTVIMRALARLDVGCSRALLSYAGYRRLYNDRAASVYFPTFRRLSSTGKRVPALRMFNGIGSTSFLVMIALREHYRGLRDTGSTPANLEADEAVRDRTRRARDLLEALLEFEAGFCSITSLDVVKMTALPTTIARSCFQADVSDVVHHVLEPYLTGNIAHSSRATLLEFCASTLCTGVNSRVCSMHTLLGLLLECLFDTGAGSLPNTLPFTDRGAEALLPLLLTDASGTGVNWRAIVPATMVQRTDVSRTGHAYLTSLGSFLAYHFRLPESLRRWSSPGSAGSKASSSVVASTLTGYSYWLSVEQLSRRPWVTGALKEMKAAARTAGVWWLTFVKRLELTGGQTVVAARGCTCNLCQHSAPEAALALQHTAVAFTVDVCVGRGDDYFSCAVVCDPANLSHAELRAVWPALLHAAAFYQDESLPCSRTACPHFETDNVADYYKLANLGRLGCELLWVNVLSVAVRLHDADALRLALWLAPLCSSDYTFGAAHSMEPLLSAVESTVQLVAAGVVRRRLPAGLLRDVLDAVARLEAVAHSRGVPASVAAGGPPSDVGAAVSIFDLADFQPAVQLLARGQHRAACALLRAGARVDDPAMLLHLSPTTAAAVTEAVAPQEAAVGAGGGARAWSIPPTAVASASRKRHVQAAVGAAGWARRKHALAARARARWAQWAAAAAEEAAAAVVEDSNAAALAGVATE